MFRILVVEDNVNLRKLYSAILKSNGYTTLTAGNGAEALEVMKREHVDLLVLDIMMPVMDGYELTDVLRQGGSEIPILMITAKSEQADKRAGFLVGIDDYMTKPVDEEEMLLRIKALLRRSKIVSERRMETKARSRCPRRSSTCSTNCSPTPDRYSPSSSCWTRYGGWRTSLTTRSTCT